MSAALTTTADPMRPMPADSDARFAAAQAAVASLRAEQRRLERLGLETPLARCHQQLRYWEFVAGLLALPRASQPGFLDGGSSWLAAPRR